MKAWHLPFALLALIVFPGQTQAIDLPGSGLWTGLLLGEIDTNGDGLIDSGEWQDGAVKAFDALDPQGDGVITEAKVDAVHMAISETLGETGATVAVGIIKRLLGVTEAKTLTREDFEKRAAKVVRKLDADGDASLDEAELKGMPVVFLAWTLKAD